LDLRFRKRAEEVDTRDPRVGGDLVERHIHPVAVEQAVLRDFDGPAAQIDLDGCRCVRHFHASVRSIDHSMFTLLTSG
jgi:hypothetical protein